MKITVKQLKKLVCESMAINDDGDDLLGPIPDLGHKLLTAIDVFDAAVQEYAKASRLERSLMRDFKSSVTDMRTDVNLIISAVEDDFTSSMR